VILEVIYEDEVEQYTMDMCKACFQLTENTPPMMEPLQSALGFMGTTEAAQQILTGTYVPPPEEVDEHT
jgi:hypothetical protein